MTVWQRLVQQSKETGAEGYGDRREAIIFTGWNLAREAYLESARASGSAKEATYSVTKSMFERRAARFEAAASLFEAAANLLHASETE
jgi:hypothetical protein